MALRSEQDPMATCRQVRRPRGPTPPPAARGGAPPVFVAVLRQAFGLFRRLCCERRALPASGRTTVQMLTPVPADSRRSDIAASSASSADAARTDWRASQSPRRAASRRLAGGQASSSRTQAVEKSEVSSASAIYSEASHNASVESLKFDDAFKEIIDRDGAALGGFERVRSLTPPPRGSATWTSTTPRASGRDSSLEAQQHHNWATEEPRLPGRLGTWGPARSNTKTPVPGNPLCNPLSSQIPGPLSSGQPHAPGFSSEPVVEAFMQDRRRANLAKAVERHRASRLGTSQAEDSCQGLEADRFRESGAEFFAKYGMEEVGRLLEAEAKADKKSAAHLPAFGGGLVEQVSTATVGETVQDDDELHSANAGPAQVSARARPLGSEPIQKPMAKLIFPPSRHRTPPRGAQQPRPMPGAQQPRPPPPVQHVSSSTAMADSQYQQHECEAAIFEHCATEPAVPVHGQEGASQNQELAPDRGQSPAPGRFRASVPASYNKVPRGRNLKSSLDLQRRRAAASPSPVKAEPIAGFQSGSADSAPSSPPKPSLESPSFFSGQPHPAVASAAAAAAAARTARLAGLPVEAALVEEKAEVKSAKAPGPQCIAADQAVPGSGSAVGTAQPPPPKAKAKAAPGTPGPPPPPKAKAPKSKMPGPPPPPKAKGKAMQRRHTLDSSMLADGKVAPQTSKDGPWVCSQRLYWRELQGAGEATNSIFDQADAPDAPDLAANFNWEELQELFGAREDSSPALRRRNTVGNIGVPTKDADGSKEASVLTQRQAMSIMIITHKIGDLASTVQRLHQLEALSEDDVGRLRELAEIVQEPQAARLRQLMAQPDAKLRPVERQLVPLMQLSRVSERLRLMSLANALPGYRENLCGAAADIAMSASEICSSSALKHLIRSALTIRDYVQQGPEALKGSSAPRVMEIGSMLSGLREFKAATTPAEASAGRVSLLHFFVRSLLRMKPQFDDELREELPSLEAAMRTPWSGLCDDLAQLRSDSAFAVAELQSHADAYQDSNADEGSPTFQRLTFLSSIAAQTVDEAIQALNAAASALEELGRYFGVRMLKSASATNAAAGVIPKDPPGLAVIRELHGLLQGFGRACTEVRDIDGNIEPKQRSRSPSPGCGDGKSPAQTPRQTPRLTPRQRPRAT